MPDREVVIRCLINCISDEYDCSDKCQYFKHNICVYSLMYDAAQLLKKQEPRLVVKEDFVNADKYGYLPVFVENKDGEMYWDCITDAALGDTISRFWTMKPTDEQRKAVKWNV